VQPADIVGLVRGAGGTLRTTTRRLGVQLGRPAASVHGELRRLATAGLISLNADSRGTLITVVPVARLNKLRTALSAAPHVCQSPRKPLKVLGPYLPPQSG